MTSQQQKQQLRTNYSQGSKGFQSQLLLQEEQPAYRVVSTDELLWTELCNLFNPSTSSSVSTDDN